MYSQPIHPLNITDFAAQPVLDRVRELQRLVYYAASRFQAILNAFGARRFNAEARDFLAPRFAAELDWILRLIAIATAMISPLDIPMLLRILASHSPSIWNDPGSLQLSDDFLLYLDGGVDPDDPAALATSYSHDWWNQIDSQDPPDILDDATAAACLEHHELVTGRALPGVRSVPQAADKSTEEAAVHLANARGDVQGLIEVYTAQRNHAIRRASALYQLYCGAKNRDPEAYELFQDITKELRSRNLSENQVMDLFSEFQNKEPPNGSHTGYDWTLESGSYQEGSPVPSSPPRRRGRAKAAAQDSSVPDITTELPDIFSKHPLRNQEDIPLDVVAAFQRTAPQAAKSASTVPEPAEVEVVPPAAVRLESASTVPEPAEVEVVPPAAVRLESEEPGMNVDGHESDAAAAVTADSSSDDGNTGDFNFGPRPAAVATSATIPGDTSSDDEDTGDFNFGLRPAAVATSGAMASDSSSDNEDMGDFNFGPRPVAVATSATIPGDTSSDDEDTGDFNFGPRPAAVATSATIPGDTSSDDEDTGDFNFGPRPAAVATSGAMASDSSSDDEDTGDFNFGPRPAALRPGATMMAPVNMDVDDDTGDEGDDEDDDNDDGDLDFGLVAAHPVNFEGVIPFDGLYTAAEFSHIPDDIIY
ncbi:hypothetical protein FPV67DRAFT_1455248 [Lyophyllum atratum]|nr:hypothetical protein FPV67DRAFT_1455248 [Lyophyllum atratum]